jgi:hypothetical protein
MRSRSDGEGRDHHQSSGGLVHFTSCKVTLVDHFTSTEQSLIALRVFQAGGVLKTMLCSKIKIAAVIALLLTLAGACLWRATTEGAVSAESSDESFRVTINEVLNDENTYVSQVRIEARPGSTVEVLSDDKRSANKLSAELHTSIQQNEPSSAQLIVFADQVELKEGSTNAVKFLIGFKAGSISTGTSSTKLMPADAKQLSDVLKVHIKSGEFPYGQETKLVTFLGVTRNLAVTRPKQEP